MYSDLDTKIRHHHDSTTSSSSDENDAEMKSLTWNLNEKRFRSCHRRCSELGDFNIVRATLQLADAHLRRENYSKALITYETIARTPANIPLEVRARAYHGMGVVYSTKNDVELSRMSFESSIQYLSRCSGGGGRCGVDLAESYYCLGVTLRKSSKEDDKDASMLEFLRALEIRRNILGCDNLLVAETLTIIGKVHLERNEQVEACQAFSEAKRIETINGRGQSLFDSNSGKKSCVFYPRRDSITCNSNGSWMFAASAA